MPNDDTNAGLHGIAAVNSYEGEIATSEVHATHCPHNSKISCSNCRLNDLCLPIALTKPEVDQLDNIVQQNRPHKKGDFLYRQADSFNSVFAVRSGSFKSYSLTPQGQSRVTGFYLPGEIVGMDGIASGNFSNSVVAMEHSSTCEIPFSQLEKLSQQLPNLQHHFFAIMSNEIAKDQELHAMLSSFTAEARVASFLVSLSTRYARASFSPFRFVLAMTRGDIGAYLGLTIETVSRILTGLQRKELIKVSNREIEIVNIDDLRTVFAPT